MSTVMTEPESVEQPDSEHDPSVPDAALLEDKMPEWFRTPPSFAGFAFLVAFVFAAVNLIVPLSHTDLWGHLSYGRLIWQTGVLPTTEPLMPLSKGVAFVDTAWLTQLFGYWAYNVAGKGAIAFLNGLGIALAVGFLIKRVYSRTQSPMLVVTALFLCMWLGWQQLLIVRPQLVGVVFFSATFFCLTRRKWSQAMWGIMPAMFALWANMHGSFVVGIGLLSCFTLGRAFDLLRRTGKIKALFTDNRFRRLLLVTQLSAVATLLNPYGVAIYPEIMTFSKNANLQDIVEWYPLNLRMLQGQAAVATGILLFIAYRISPRRVTGAEVLTLTLLGVSMMWSCRLIVWWAPLAAYYFTIHMGATLGKWKSSAPVPTADDEEFEEGPSRASLWTVVGIFIFIIGFILSPMGGAALDLAFKKDPNKRLNQVRLNQATPVLATEYLRKNPPKGLIYNPYEYGDYLTWAGPKDLQVFLNSHAHLVPEDVWDDYMSISRLNSSERLLDRYSINTVMLDHRVRQPLINRMLDNEAWRRVYDDSVATIFVRKEPL